MSPRRTLALVALVAGATLASGGAAAQADNSNSLTFPDRLWIQLFERASVAPESRSPLDEVYRRPTGDRHAEGLSAAELGLLYGGIESSAAEDVAAQ